MDWIIYIDESGSISQKKEEPFLVTLTLIDKSRHKSVRNKTKKAIKKAKNEIGINYKNELKSTELNKKKKGRKEIKEKLHKSLSSLEGVSFWGCYLLSSRDLKDKWVEKPNLTFNLLVRCAIEKIIENKKEINGNSTITIDVDNRNVKISSFKCLNEYLYNYFILEKNKIKSITINYKESSKNWGIQLCDLKSNYIWHSIKANNIPHDLKNNIRFFRT